MRGGGMTKILKWAGAVVALAVVVGAGIIGVAYSGLYDVAADVPHSKPVYWLMQLTRNRSIAVHAGSVHVPSDLLATKRVLTGAGLYAGMCTSCHLAPGMARTEISQGLYPAAPELAKGTDLSPAEEFWVIKHGIKMTGMAAWGRTHSDTLIWDMVAFLQKLPTLSPAAYQAVIRMAP
ncbi:MAG: cytochrome c, partial [Alphaproteobacteria bacterium]|nr:cytochrome c [Alphaproteobacteria bacterium]